MLPFKIKLLVLKIRKAIRFYECHIIFYTVFLCMYWKHFYCHRITTIRIVDYIHIYIFDSIDGWWVVIRGMVEYLVLIQTQRQVAVIYLTFTISIFTSTWLLFILAVHLYRYIGTYIYIDIYRYICMERERGSLSPLPYASAVGCLLNHSVKHFWVIKTKPDCDCVVGNFMQRHLEHSGSPDSRCQQSMVEWLQS